MTPSASPPGQMEIRPSIRDDELNDARHDEEAERHEERAEAKDEQDRQRDLGNADHMGDDDRRREVVSSAENVKLELLREEILGGWRQRKEPVPAREA